MPQFEILTTRGMWQDVAMPRRSSKSKDHDFATVARRVVEQAIGTQIPSFPQSSA